MIDLSGVLALLISSVSLAVVLYVGLCIVAFRRADLEVRKLVLLNVAIIFTLGMVALNLVSIFSVSDAIPKSTEIVTNPSLGKHQIKNYFVTEEYYFFSTYDKSKEKPGFIRVPLNSISSMTSAKKTPYIKVFQEKAGVEEVNVKKVHLYK